MNRWVTVTRYHLINRAELTAQPWVVLALAFAVNLAVFVGMPDNHGQARYTGGLASVYLLLCIVGAITVSRNLPLSRRR